jgi:hypothetical protein
MNERTVRNCHIFTAICLTLTFALNTASVLMWADNERWREQLEKPKFDASFDPSFLGWKSFLGLSD